MAFLFVMGLLLGTISGCTSQQAIENAHARGAQIGRDMGYSEGKAAGFTTAADAARQEAYRDTLNRLYFSGDYRRRPLYTLVVVVGFFALGFWLQWIALYLLREAGFLPDIDRILLPKEMTEVDLRNLVVAELSPKLLLPTSTVTMLMLLLSLLSMTGCKDPEREAWQQGLNAAYRTAYWDGWQEGAALGKLEGEQQGRAAAHKAAATGHAWRLYSTVAFWALMFGVMVGLSTQYAILVYCKLTGRLPELLAVAFIPAIKSSVTYAVFQRRRQLLVWFDEEMRKLAAAREFRIAQIQTVHQLMRRKFKAISSLNDFRHVCRLDLVKKELSKIVSDSEQEARRIAGGQKVPAELRAWYVIICPHCSKRIGYKGKKGGKTVMCPHEGCGRPVDVPRLSTNGRNSSLITIGDESLNEMVAHPANKTPSERRS